MQNANSKFKLHIKVIDTFKFALKGLKIVIISQRNFRIHLVIAAIVVVSGLIAGLSLTEWCILVTTIFLVLAMEVMNSALEKLVDFISPGFHEMAGTVKDISAAAVLLTAIAAVITGLIIFLPKVI